MNISIESFKKSNLQILSFFGLTFIVKIIYSFSSKIDFSPMNDVVGEIHQLLIYNITIVSAKIINILFNTEVSIANNCELFNNAAELKIYSGCSGFAQLVQFVLFFAIIKGRTFNKLWFIPVGILIIHLTNIIRMSGLYLTLVYIPKYYEFFHAHLFRVMFYGVIFLLWMVWVERVSEREFKIPSLKGLAGGL